MPSLLELQSAFGSALARDDAPLRAGAVEAQRDGAGAASLAIESFVVGNGLEPRARLRIYRNNSRENFLAALRGAFPVIERLSGTQYFEQLAREYRERFPSRSGNLHHVGERFTDFLQHTFGTTRYAYFADVARLEWAVQEATIAADHAPLDLARLATVPEHDYPRLVFDLHPATRLAASRFPILTIWKANQNDADEHPQIDLDSGGERVLLLRAQQEVELRPLGAAEFSFLNAIASGQPLAAALESAGVAAGADGLDAAALLRGFVAAGVLVDFRVPGDST